MITLASYLTSTVIVAVCFYRIGWVRGHAEDRAEFRRVYHSLHDQLDEARRAAFPMWKPGPRTKDYP